MSGTTESPVRSPIMRIVLLFLLLSVPAAASPVMVPKVQGLPITEPAAPVPPPCVPLACPTRT